ncbi:MAG: hypothetical protein ACOX3S_00930 [Anaerolineae bacterium]|jgi:hypothetical protein
MSRVINSSSPGSVRNAARRTIAEILRQMVAKRSLDGESRDMAAAIVLELDRIAGTIETTCDAWEKRNYFLKADRFRLEWEWVQPAADRLRDVIVDERWDQAPLELAKLLPRFADVRIAKMTRSSEAWDGALAELLATANGGSS